MSILFLFDRFILAKFQKFSDWSQVTFGINNFWFARISVALFTSAILIRQFVDFFIDTSVGSRVLTIIFLLLAIGIGYLCAQSINITEKECVLAPDTRNSKEETWRLLRSHNLFLISFSVVIILSLLLIESSKNIEPWLWSLMRISDTFFLFYIIGYTLFTYFTSCTPNPYQKSKLKKLAERIEKVLTMKPALVNSS